MCPISLRNRAAELLAIGGCDASTAVSGMFKICLCVCLFAVTDDRLPDYVSNYLKPFACSCQRISAVLGVKKRRGVAPPTRDNQLRVEVPVLIHSK